MDFAALPLLGADGFPPAFVRLDREQHLRHPRCDRPEPRRTRKSLARHSAPLHAPPAAMPSLRLLPAAFLATLTATAHADVRVPAIISDHMVLQQETPANIWGWADAGEKVSVKFAGKTAETAADAKGRWQVKLEDLKPGTTGALTISGKNTLTVNDVIVGEVWLASGQSNMEWIVGNSKDGPAEIAAANFPAIRIFTAVKNAQAEPQENVPGQWEVTSPNSVWHFTAVGYYFARKLHQALGQPVGIIHSSWGGTAAELWTPKAVLASDPIYKPILDAWQMKVAAYPQAKAAYDAEMAKWRDEEKAAREAGRPVPPEPRGPQGGDAIGSPSSLFNGMIAPLAPYTIRGAIWYQGESNAGNARQYRKLFPSMILSWRRAWDAEFPFLFVQLANFNATQTPPTGQPGPSKWAELREAQTMTLDLPRTGMAVTIDIGDSTNIHPKNKQEVGRRLSLIAEATVYFHEQEYGGPLFTDAQTEGARIRLSFRNSQGLKASGGDKLKGFAIAGADRKFVWADAKIDGDHILVSSPDVKAPAAVRYAWADDPECNLVNQAGLPASPFRTDDWEQ
jgi:sialate O-acetylesterase